ncbi:hypothetical protein J2X66_005792 [Pseudomonas sp. 3296]|nr:hypothetical protein [Pseudomonas sp. 3296]
MRNPITPKLARNVSVGMGVSSKVALRYPHGKHVKQPLCLANKPSDLTNEFGESGVIRLNRRITRIVYKRGRGIGIARSDLNKRRF